MELEEMKNVWDEMSLKIKKQERINTKLILMMTKQNYRTQLGKIALPEFIGAIICYAGLIWLILNFKKLDTWYLQVCGIISGIIIFSLPLMSLRALQKMRAIDLALNNYKQTLLVFTKWKKQFMFVQKLGFYLSFILVIVCLPVAGKIMNGKDLLLENTVWVWYLPLGFIVLIVFAKWVYKHYKSSTSKAEQLLKDLENPDLYSD